jgi:hypothetical protein
MDEDDGFLRHLSAQMDRRQIEAAERGDCKNHQTGKRGAWSAARQRRVEEHKQADGPQRRISSDNAQGASFPCSTYTPASVSPPSAPMAKMMRALRSMARSSCCEGRGCSYSLQIFDQILLLHAAEVELQQGIVMIDHVEQRGEASIVVEAAFLVRPQSGQRRRAIHVGR